MRHELLLSLSRLFLSHLSSGIICSDLATCARRVGRRERIYPVHLHAWIFGIVSGIFLISDIQAGSGSQDVSGIGLRGDQREREEGGLCGSRGALSPRLRTPEGREEGSVAFSDELCVGGNVRMAH